MPLKNFFHSGLALMLALPFAMAVLKADDPANDAHYGQTEQELIFVAALNEYRTARGLHSVGVSAELSQACRSWSTQMRQSGRLSHDPRGGTEICAQISQESGMNALQAWQRSPAHNAILLSSRIDTIGIGSDGIWWTMRGIQGGAERTVFRTTDARTEVTDEVIGRVPMGVSVSSVQRAASAGVVQTAPSPSSQPSTEVMDEIIGRVPMGVSQNTAQRVVSNPVPFPFRVFGR